MIKFDNSKDRDKRHRYAIYLRKSRADIEKEAHGEFETLAMHEYTLRDFMRRERMRIDDSDIYRELVSGESLEKRYEFRRLMGEVSNGKYTGIVVFAIDRLGRGDMLEYGWILSVLKYTGTLIITPGRTYDPTVSADMQMLQMMMLFAQVEVSSYTFRLSENKEAKCKMGQYIGTRPPLGYEKCVVDRMKTLRPSKDATVVMLAFEMVAKTGNVRGTASKLNEAGYRTQHNKPFSPKAVKRIINNETYIGKIRWGVTRVEVSGIDGVMKKKESKRQEEYLLFDGLHEPLVSEELWRAANARIGSAPRVKQDNTVKNPLAGVLVCAKCGRSMKRKTSIRGSKRHDYITHATHTDCERQKSAMLHVVVDAVIDALEDTIQQMDMLIETGVESMADAEKKHLDSEIASAERRYEKLVELYTAEKIALDVYDRQEAALTDSLEKLKARRRKLDSEGEGKPSVIRASSASAIAILRDEGMPAKAKSDFIKTIIEKAEYDNSQVGSDDQRISIKIHFK